MAVGDLVQVRGYISQDKFLIGRSLDVLERHLGYAKGRLGEGAIFVRLDRLPYPYEFDLAGYSQTAEHRFAPNPNLNVAKLKEMVRERWTPAGADRLIKVWPKKPADLLKNADELYPPGAGIPQWKITCSGIPGTIIAEIPPGQIYIPRG
jgi:hypothetical protein